MLSLSAHKFHGPKGVGFLFIDGRVKIHPLLYGGGQQKDLRSGTENVPAIAGMARAAEEIYRNLDEDAERMYELRARLEEGSCGWKMCASTPFPAGKRAPCAERILCGRAQRGASARAGG